MTIKYRIIESVDNIFTIQSRQNISTADWDTFATSNSFNKALKLIQKHKKDFNGCDIKIHYID